LNSARKTKSQVKLALKEIHKIDMDDEIKYPDVKKKWKAYKTYKERFQCLGSKETGSLLSEQKDWPQYHPPDVTRAVHSCRSRKKH